MAQVGDEALGYSVGFGLPFAKPAFGLGESGLKAADFARGAVGKADELARKVPHGVDLLGGARQRGQQQ